MAFFRGPNIVRDGLKIYLDSANSKSLISIDGSSSWLDLSNNENNAKFLIDGEIESDNGGVRLGEYGINKIILDCGTLNIFNFGSPFTISFFIKINSLDASIYPFNPILQKYGSSGPPHPVNRNTHIIYNEDFLIWQHNDLRYIISELIMNEVFSLVINYDGENDVLAYINGVYTNSLSHIFENTDVTNLYLGIFEDWIYGDITLYNFMYHNIELTPSQILQNYNALKNRYL